MEAHEADLNAIEISSQAATAFVTQHQGASKSSRPPPPSSYNNQNQRSRQIYQPIRPPYYHCNNCGREGHAASRCYAPGGGLAGRTPWKGNQVQFNNSLNQNKIANYNPQNFQNLPQSDGPSNSAHLAGNDSPNIVMMAKIKEITQESTILLSNLTSSILKVKDNAHIWLLDSAASSHLSGKIKPFNSIYLIPPVRIHMANGDSFTANQKGTIHLTLHSKALHMSMPNLPITLVDVIYVPHLNANLLSVGKMTNANMGVNFCKNYSYLSRRDEILAYRAKISNLFTYTAIITPKPKIISAQYAEFTESTLGHHRLVHTNYHTIEKMSCFKLASGLLTKIYINDAPMCINCPYGKQACAPFKENERFPLEIGDIIVSDLCGPFKTSIGGYKYFIT